MLPLINLNQKTKQINKFSYTSVDLQVFLKKCIQFLPSNVTLDIFFQVCFTRKSLLTVYFETIKIVIKQINQDFSYVFRKPFRTLIMCVLYIPFSHSYFTNSLRKPTMLHTK